MTRSISPAARQLAAGALAWLLFLTSPALAQLGSQIATPQIATPQIATPQIAQVMGAFATPDANLDVVRLTFGRPNDQFSYFTPGGARIGIDVRNQRSAPAGFGEDNRLPTLVGPTLFGARLDRDIGPVDLTVSGRVGAMPHAALGVDGLTMWSTGLEIGLRGLSIAGFYTEQGGHDAETAYSYDAALRYRIGPWGFALAYTSGSARSETPGNDPERLEQYTLALNYRLASNVEFAAYGGYVDGNPVNDRDAEQIDDDISGFVFGTGLSLDF